MRSEPRRGCVLSQVKRRVRSGGLARFLLVPTCTTEVTPAYQVASSVGGLHGIPEPQRQLPTVRFGKPPPWPAVDDCQTCSEPQSHWQCRKNTEPQASLSVASIGAQELT
jgi:hypothetical protein